jgi:hypothetical protein
MEESLLTVDLDDFVPRDHPLRAVGLRVNELSTPMNAQYKAIRRNRGSDSIAREKPNRALLHVFYSVRNERPPRTGVFR